MFPVHVSGKINGFPLKAKVYPELWQQDKKKTEIFISSLCYGSFGFCFCFVVDPVLADKPEELKDGLSVPDIGAALFFLPSGGLILYLL